MQLARACLAGETNTVTSGALVCCNWGSDRNGSLGWTATQLETFLSLFQFSVILLNNVDSRGHAWKFSILFLVCTSERSEWVCHSVSLYSYTAGQGEDYQLMRIRIKNLYWRWYSCDNSGFTLQNTERQKNKIPCKTVYIYIFLDVFIF